MRLARSVQIGDGLAVAALAIILRRRVGVKPKEMHSDRIAAAAGSASAVSVV